MKFTFILIFIYFECALAHIHEMMFYYNYDQLRNNMNHPLVNTNYKTIVLNKKELIVFANQRKSSVTIDMKDYLYTIKYKNIPLMCNEYNTLCTYKEFIKEKKWEYKDAFGYNIPVKIKEMFNNDVGCLEERCVILMHENVNDINKSVWICNESKMKLKMFVKDLVEYIENDNEEYSFFGTVNDNEGMIILNENELIYKSVLLLSTNKNNNNHIETYSYGNIKEFGYIDTLISRKSSCFVIETNNDNKRNVICVQYGRNDVMKQFLLKETIAEFIMKEIYLPELNKRMLKYKIKHALLNENNIEHDLYKKYILIGVRYEYIRKKYLLENEFDYNNKCLNESINSVCLNMTKCIVYVVTNVIKNNKMNFINNIPSMYAYNLGNVYNYLIEINNNNTSSSKENKYLTKETLLHWYTILKSSNTLPNSNISQTYYQLHALLYMNPNNNIFHSYLNKYLN